MKRKYNYNCNYIVYSNTGTMNDAKLGGIEYYEDINKIKLYVWDDDIIHPGFFAISSAYILVIPIGNYEGSIRIQELYTYDEYKNIISPTDESTIFGPSVDKPIIYIYPEEETEVTVELGRKDNLTCTYPLYEDKWEVTAKSDGTLIDEETGRTYYALYWEGINSKRYSNKLEEGFVVKGEDTIKFLEEKLEILGLNEKEAEEFIVYWLPKMQNNKYNYIRFQTIEEINENMPLEVTPEPDTLIRVMMEWKGLNKYIEVEEQQLEKAERKDYTVVEWGGTEIK